MQLIQLSCCRNCLFSFFCRINILLHTILLNYSRSMQGQKCTEMAFGKHLVCRWHYWHDLKRERSLFLRSPRFHICTCSTLLMEPSSIVSHFCVLDKVPAVYFVTRGDFLCLFSSCDFTASSQEKKRKKKKGKTKSPLFHSDYIPSYAEYFCGGFCNWLPPPTSSISHMIRS